MNPRIAILGTGRMGSALARAFLSSGFEVNVWNRTREKAAPLAQQNAKLASSPEAAVDASDLVIPVVDDYDVGDAIIKRDEVARVLEGKLLLELSSGSASQARARGKWAREHGVAYLDGAIMATPDMIGLPEATLLYAGPSALYERTLPLLRVLGGNPQYVGEDLGHASTLDGALLVSMWGALFGALQGAALCEAEKLSLELYEQHMGAVTPVTNGGVTDLLQRIRTRRFAGDETSPASVSIHHGAFRHMLAQCREHGLHHAVPDAFGTLFEAALRAGRGQDDFAVLSQFMRAPPAE